MLADALAKCINGTKITAFANQIFITNENWFEGGVLKYILILMNKI